MIKKEKNDIYKKRKKKKRKEKRKGDARRVLPFYTFAAIHQGPWSIYTICVCGLA